jgi:hypothetical protein
LQKILQGAERKSTLDIIRAFERQEHKDPVDVFGCRRGLCAGLMGNLLMPAWLEIVLDVAGFAGFIAIASWRRSPRKNGKPAPR